MKKLLILLLLSSGVWAQTVDFDKFATKEDVRKANARVDSLNRALSGAIVIPPVGIPDCDHGPDIKNVYAITKTGLTFLFDAVGVTPIQWKVSNIGDTASVARGVVAPTSNSPTIQFGKTLTAKPYRLWIDGVICKNDKGVIPYTFSVPGSTGEVDPPVVVPPVEQTGKIYEATLNLTGEGFESTYWDSNQKKLVDNPDGVKKLDYIDKFKENGKYTITSVRVALPWYEFEKTPGVYEVEGVKRMIKTMRDRGLILHVCFLPWRKYGDGFFTPDSFMKGSRGGVFYPVNITKEATYNTTMASYADDQTNAKIKKAVQVLSETLATYERAGYLGLGSGRGEEFVMPNFETRIREATATDPGYSITEASDLSGLFMEKFRAWVEKRNLTTYRIPDFDSENGYLDASNEIGKEYMRFCTYTLRKYFDNFADGVREGSTKVNVCFFIPSVGTHQNANELVAYFSYIAKNADELYHSDGAFAWDNERKPNGIRVFRGTFPNKLAIAEIDPQDAGYQPGWGTGQVTAEQLASIARSIYEVGGQNTELAMHFMDSAIPEYNRAATMLKDFIGKPFNPPPVTMLNTVIVDITKDPHNVFKNDWLYEDVLKAKPWTYINQVETPDFWGGVLPDIL